MGIVLDPTRRKSWIYLQSRSDYPLSLEHRDRHKQPGKEYQIYEHDRAFAAGFGCAFQIARGNTIDECFDAARKYFTERNRQKKKTKNA